MVIFRTQAALFAPSFQALTPVTAVYVVVDPATAVVSAGTKLTASDIILCRTIAFIAAFCSAAVYGLIGLGMHRSMVRNFDMIIRKQSA